MPRGGEDEGGEGSSHLALHQDQVNAFMHHPDPCSAESAPANFLQWLYM